MVELVSFDGSKFGSKFVKNEVISLVPVTVTKNNGVAEMHSVSKEVREWENLLDLGSDRGRHIF